MANLHHDLANETIRTAGNAYGTAVSATGGLTTVDGVDAASNMASALLTSTAVAGSGNVTTKIQESSDDSTWTDITGATFTAVTAANATQLISFQVTKRYIRGYATLNSGTSVTQALTFILNRKFAPANSPGWVNESTLGT